MKAILVVDIAKCCEECRLINNHYDNEYGWRTYCGADYHIIREKNKRYFCPFKPLPQKNKYDVEKYPTVDYENNVTLGHYLNNGWNACIDEILGETE